MSATEKATPLDSLVSVSNLIRHVHQPALSDEIQSFVCGHCERTVGGLVVASIPGSYIQWLLCPICKQGSVRHHDAILPSLLPVPQVEGLPLDICLVYDEARKSFAVQAYTGCELLCRKILMSVAVDKGATEGDTFEHYVDYLKGNGHITASLKDMADTVRQNGNKSTHKIEQPDPERSKYTLEFTAQVLRSVYEIEAQFSKYQGHQTST